MYRIPDKCWCGQCQCDEMAEFFAKITTNEMLVWLYEHRWVDVDPQTQVVTDLRLGEPLTVYTSSNRVLGFWITLSKNNSVFLPLRRLVAIKLFGPNAAEDKAVRVADDGAGGKRYWLAGSSSQREAPRPCANCHTLGGRRDPDCTHPKRYNGERFGFDGVLCRACYNREYGRLKNTSRGLVRGVRTYTGGRSING